MPTSVPAETVIDRLLNLAAQIQQMPAPTFKERKRYQLVQGLFTAKGLQDISMDILHNVKARLPERQAGIPLIVTAHLDTVFLCADTHAHTRGLTHSQSGHWGQLAGHGRAAGMGVDAAWG